MLGSWICSIFKCFIYNPLHFFHKMLGNVIVSFLRKGASETVYYQIDPDAWDRMDETSITPLSCTPCPEGYYKDATNSQIWDYSKWSSQNGLCQPKTFNIYALVVLSEACGNLEDPDNVFLISDPIITYTADQTLKYSCQQEVEVVAPLIDFTKDEIVKLAIKNNAPLELITSCYNDYTSHCGKCESCLRLKRALEKNNCKELIKKLFN